MTNPPKPQPKTRWRTRPWPWPEDVNREDKAKRVARSYRGLVERIVRGECDNPGADLYLLDQEWHELDIHWHRRDELADVLADRDDEWMSARELAHALDRERRDIYNWARAGHIEQRCSHDGSPEYLVSSVKSYLDSLRQRRSRNRAGDLYENRG